MNKSTSTWEDQYGLVMYRIVSWMTEIIKHEREIDFSNHTIITSIPGVSNPKKLKRAFCHQEKKKTEYYLEFENATTRFAIPSDQWHFLGTNLALIADLLTPIVENPS